MVGAQVAHRLRADRVRAVARAHAHRPAGVERDAEDRDVGVLGARGPFDAGEGGDATAAAEPGGAAPVRRIGGWAHCTRTVGVTDRRCMSRTIRSSDMFSSFVE